VAGSFSPTPAGPLNGVTVVELAGMGPGRTPQCLGHVLWAMLGDGRWSDARGANIFDGSAPLYPHLECADGCYVRRGCARAGFSAELLRLLEIDPDTLGESSHRPSASLALRSHGWR
jgi:hypothetical protein